MNSNSSNKFFRSIPLIAQHFLLTLVFYSSLSHAQNIWQKTNGPYGPGYVTSINKDFNGRLYAAVDQGGLYRSEDDGNSFSYINIPSDISVYAIHFDRQNHILAGGYSSKGIFRSSDEGNTWTQVLPQFTEDICSDSGGNIYAGTLFSGIFKSSDNGVTWNQIDINATVKRVFTIKTSPSGDLFVSGDKNSFDYRTLRSTDNGLTWEVLTLPSVGNVSILDFAFSPDGHIAACFKASFDSSGFLLSSDNGNTWTRNNITDSYYGVVSVIYDTPGNCFYAALSNQSFDWEIIKSTDLGYTWSFASVISYSQPDRFTLFSDQNGSLYVGNFKGLKRSTDQGINWAQADNDFFALAPDYLTLLPDGRIFTRTYHNSVYKLAEDKMNWVPDSGHAGSFLISKNGEYFLSDWEIHKSTNKGSTWYTVFDPPGSWSQTREMTKLSNGYILCGGIYSDGVQGGAAVIWRSVNYGGIWQSAYIHSPANYINTISASADDIIIAGEQDNGVIRSTDLGLTWSLSTSGLPPDISTHIIRFNNSGIVFLGSVSHGMYRSSDCGESWHEINNGLSSSDIRSIAINSIGVIFIGTSSGVFKSEDNGNNWIPMNSGLVDLSIRSLLITPDDFLYASTWATGIYRTISSTTSMNEDIIGTAEYLLYQNYPNPFNPLTTISFYLPASQDVQLKIFDIMGNEIAAPLNGFMESGKHNIEFDGRNLSSGIYFYQFKTKEFIQTKKFILLK